MPLFRRQSAFLRQFRLSYPFKKVHGRSYSIPPPSPSSEASQSRLRKLNDRLPRFLRTYTTPLFGAPGTHITSFLILHEITAIVPLFVLVAAFHYGNWLPDLTSSIAFAEGTQRFGRWLRKKGWVEDVEMDVTGVDGGVDHRDYVAEKQSAEGEKKGVRLVLEFATAYAVTKALLPLRIAASVWATPWFARVVLTPVGRQLRGLLRR
ncbi:hypothetical protein BBP40_000995 [Aspergillus hancockii]|nr:hypothetical protein BBP40_000995 [Aspergillus hancockii]